MSETKSVIDGKRAVKVKAIEGSQVVYIPYSNLRPTGGPFIGRRASESAEENALEFASQLEDGTPGTVKVAPSEKRRLGLTVGCVIAKDGTLVTVVSRLWLAVLIAALVVIFVVACIVNASTTGIPVVGGMLPTAHTTVTTETEVGMIEIPGYDASYTVNEDTVIELRNPESNQNYYFKYIITVGDEVVHESSEYIEAGKVDSWQMYPDLAKYAGQTINMTIKVAPVKAETFEECNAAAQTVQVTVK